MIGDGSAEVLNESCLAFKKTAVSNLKLVTFL